MQVNIDSKSGFCFGVVNAITIAEEQLEKYGSLFCLGDIVHNSKEIDRLRKKGLVVIDHEDMKDLFNTRLLIRAHGEPPQTYQLARENNIDIIDASCPVVLKLQSRIRKGFNEMETKNGQIVIFGKQGHAEVNGLIGQTNGKAIVIGSDLSNLDQIDFSRPIELYSQTTQSIEELHKLVEEFKNRIHNHSCEKPGYFSPNDTICRQVANRGPHLAKYATQHDVIIFVSGKKSSNGLYLFNICKENNTRSYMVSEAIDIKDEWFDKADKVGICGATSTPVWLMEEVAERINKINA